ncbi:MAG: integrase core domain-containing protein, partial [Thermoanaerobaculia bacterium]
VDWREEMALAALDGRYTVTKVASLFGVSCPTVRLWRERYRMYGREGLEDASHAPHSCPHRTDPAVEALIVAESERWGWGSKKILDRLRESHPDVSLPARSTTDAILARHGRVEHRPKRRKRQSPTPFQRRYPATEPGEVTTIDHKGEFRLRNGKYCFPLTMVDTVSRFVLACEALDSTSFARAWPVIQRVFREHGLPRAMQSDNGVPFGASNGKFSRLSVELMAIGVQPVFGRPGVPQDNARHERMHRELKRRTTRPPAANFREQQRAFDAFIAEYNVERPHEGLGGQRPARLYKSSPRPYPRRRPKPEYAPHCEKRRVDEHGSIKLNQHRIFIGHAFAGQTVALEPCDDQLWTVYFYRFEIGKLDEEKQSFL